MNAEPILQRVVKALYQARLQKDKAMLEILELTLNEKRKLESQE